MVHTGIFLNTDGNTYMKIINKAIKDLGAMEEGYLARITSHDTRISGDTYILDIFNNVSRQSLYGQKYDYIICEDTFNSLALIDIFPRTPIENIEFVSIEDLLKE